MQDTGFTTNLQTGGGERIRTDDILLAKQALYQLSYAPLDASRRLASGARAVRLRTAIAPRCGLAPGLALGSDQVRGFQRAGFRGMKTYRRRRPDNRLRDCSWWAREDLNLRPHAYQARALTN